MNSEDCPKKRTMTKDLEFCEISSVFENRTFFHLPMFHVEFNFLSFHRLSPPKPKIHLRGIHCEFSTFVRSRKLFIQKIEKLGRYFITKKLTFTYYYTTFQFSIFSNSNLYDFHWIVSSNFPYRRWTAHKFQFMLFAELYLRYPADNGDCGLKANHHIFNVYHRHCWSSVDSTVYNETEPLHKIHFFVALKMWKFHR